MFNHLEKLQKLSTTIPLQPFAFEFEATIYETLPPTLSLTEAFSPGQEHFAVEAFYDLKNLYAVFRPSKHYLKLSAHGVSETEILSIMANFYKEKEIVDLTPAQLRKRCYKDISPNPVGKVVSDIENTLGPDYIKHAYKLGRRKRGMHLVYLAEKDTSNYIVVMFPTERPSARINFFNSLLVSVTLTPVATVTSNPIFYNETVNDSQVSVGS